MQGILLTCNSRYFLAYKNLKRYMIPCPQQSKLVYLLAYVVTKYTTFVWTCIFEHGRWCIRKLNFSVLIGGLANNFGNNACYIGAWDEAFKHFPAFTLYQQNTVSPYNCVKSVRIRGYSGLHFSRIFRIRNDTPYLSVFSSNTGKCRKSMDQYNSEYGHFLRSV